MNIGKFVPTVATLIVAVVVLAGVAFPMIGGLSSETTTISNDGASWIRMAYITDQSDYSVEYTFGDNVSVAGQSGEWEDMILYADSQCTICIVGDYIVKIVGDVVAVSDDPQTMTVSRSSGIVSIDGDPISESTVSWAYVPVANGKYGSFGADTVPLHRDASNLAVVGGFAGVYAYNENVSVGLGFVMDADVTEEYINSVRWALESDIPVEETQPFHPIDPGMFDPGILNPGTDDPAVIDDPIDPSTLDPQYIDPDFGGNQIMSVPTPTYTDGDWGYDIITVSGVQKAKIVSYSGAGGGAITIPATVGGYDVHAVGSGTSPDYAVFDTSITSTSLTISNGIVLINAAAFSGCTGLTGTLTLSNTLTKIDTSAFRGCSGFTGTLTIPATTTTLTRSAFEGCTGFTSLVLNEGVTRIENASAGDPHGCFTGCTGFTGTLTLPSTLTYIGNSSFYGCTGFTSVVFNSAPTIQSVSDSRNGIFGGCTGLTGTITLLSGTVLGGYDFYGCTGITGIVLPSGMTTIPNGAFQNCVSIASLSIPSTVTTIGRNAFSGCSGITGTLTLPTGLTSIGLSAFYNCTHISGQLVLPSGLTTLDGSAFAGCSGITGELVIPSNITTLQNTVFKGCSGITSINLNNVEVIGSETFSGCTGLTGTLELSSKIQRVNQGTFSGCTGLTGLILNEGITELRNTSSNSQGAFDGCTGMTGTLVLPSTLTTIGYRTFKDCGFTNLIVLSDATPLGSGTNGAFYKWNGGIQYVLNLGSAEYTTTSYGLNADEVRSDIEATAYMAPVSISETTTKEGPTFDLLAILPIVFVAGLLLTTAWLFIRK